MNCQKLVFSSHAIQQMFFRRISKEDVRTAINYGEVIEEKPDDTPFPSYLIGSLVPRVISPTYRLPKLSQVRLLMTALCRSYQYPYHSHTKYRRAFNFRFCQQ